MFVAPQPRIIPEVQNIFQSITVAQYRKDSELRRQALLVGGLKGFRKKKTKPKDREWEGGIV